MSEQDKARENEVFDQKLELDELDAAAGGANIPNEPIFFDPNENQR